MKHRFLLLPLFVLNCSLSSAGIVFRGDTLKYNTDFKRSAAGYSPETMVEISGIACSRVTPGYIWAQSDDNYRVVALKPSTGTKIVPIQFDLTLTNKPTRKDWEDMCGGVWKDKNYLFVGGFGDNNLKYKDKYYIFYFEEPSIPETSKDSTIDIGTNFIRYGYPDGKAHNTEAMMFDNVDKVMYIIDKVGNHFCEVFSLDMNVSYDTTLQILTKVCDLGIEGEVKFQLVTGADISPDGRWILIKNHTDDYGFTLMWERKKGESVADALMRQPEQIKAYQHEWQGEAIAWLDNTTFYTASDEDGDAPIYKYVRTEPTGLETIKDNSTSIAKKILLNGTMYIRSSSGIYNLIGQRIQ